MPRPAMYAASDYHDIPFLQNVNLTNLVQNMPVQGDLRGNQLLPTVGVDTLRPEWEAVLGGRNIAPIVARDAASPLVNRPGVERHSAECLDIRQKSILDESTKLFLRRPGERESRGARLQVTRDLARMRADTESRLEKMRWDAVLTGKIDETLTVDAETIRVSYDFRVPAGQFVTAGTLWTSAATADPRTEFTAATKKVREATGRRVKQAWMNSNTHDTLDKVEVLATDFRYTEGSQDLVKNEHVTDVIKNVRIIDYDEGFKEDINWTGTFKYYLPDNKVAFTVGAIDAGEPYGDLAEAPSALADGSIVDGMFAETWTSPDPTRDYLRVGTVAIPRLYHPDWVVVYTVG